MLALDTKSLERRSLARNDVLFRQGDKVTAIYFIESGGLRLERRTFDGRTLILGTTPADNFFVEAALFSDTYHCDAVATEPSRIRIYPKTAMLDELRTDPTSAMTFLALVARQIMNLRQQMCFQRINFGTSTSFQKSTYWLRGAAATSALLMETPHDAHERFSAL
jgi:CRP-like cAMP-binding protein